MYNGRIPDNNFFIRLKAGAKIVNIGSLLLVHLPQKINILNSTKIFFRFTSHIFIILEPV